jgi:hypothetical protein
VGTYSKDGLGALQVVRETATGTVLAAGIVGTSLLYAQSLSPALGTQKVPTGLVADFGMVLLEYDKMGKLLGSQVPPFKVSKTEGWAWLSDMQIDGAGNRVWLFYGYGPTELTVGGVVQMVNLQGEMVLLETNEKDGSIAWWARVAPGKDGIGGAWDYKMAILADNSIALVLRYDPPMRVIDAYGTETLFWDFYGAVIVRFDPQGAYWGSGMLYGENGPGVNGVASLGNSVVVVGGLSGWATLADGTQLQPSYDSSGFATGEGYAVVVDGETLQPVSALTIGGAESDHALAVASLGYQTFIAASVVGKGSVKFAGTSVYELPEGDPSAALNGTSEIVLIGSQLDGAGLWATRAVTPGYPGALKIAASPFGGGQVLLSGGWSTTVTFGSPGGQQVSMPEVNDSWRTLFASFRAGDGSLVYGRQLTPKQSEAGGGELTTPSLLYAKDGSLTLFAQLYNGITILPLDSKLLGVPTGYPWPYSALIHLNHAAQYDTCP